MVTYATIEAAQQRLAPYLVPTPLEEAPGLGAFARLKLENINQTRSFKVRGALNAMLNLDDAARRRGIVTASSGNHAQGIAYAAYRSGVSARILMPPSTPKRKVAGVQRYGAEAVLHGPTYDEAEREARRLEREQGFTFISAYNHPDVISGAGTIGLEIAQQCPEVARVIVNIGGGGLIAGVATALKFFNPNIEVIGVCAEHAPAMYNHFYQKQLPQNYHTLAEALSGDIEENSITIDLTLKHVDEVVLVRESLISEAIRWMLFEQGWVVEGGGAVSVAAVLGGMITLDARPTVIIVSGGNIDEPVLRRVIARELA